jgi:hypothetical protein
MIESITLAAQKTSETIASAFKEGVDKIKARELGRSISDSESGGLTVGGDMQSVFRAMEIDPEVLGAEVRCVGLNTDAVEYVALKDSKGEVRHNLTPQEAAHYKDVGLRTQEVNNRECLVRDDIDSGQRDAYGQTNKERMERGLAPLDQEGRPYELHHIQQRPEGVLAELTRGEHRGVGIDRMLHDPLKTSEIDRVEFNKIRASHWRSRSIEV